MRYNHILFLFFLSLLGCACNQAPKGRNEEQMKLSNEISSLSKEVYQNNQAMDLEKSESLLKLLTEYTNKYRQDSLSAVYMLDAAQLSSSIGKYQQAVQFLMNYVEHPSAAKKDYATYLVGYQYDAFLKQPQQAEKYYRATIERYPDSPWAKTANQSLQWTGMSDEEIIKKLESESATTSNK
jgi:tetratricopeptide (TPR) repeat protein